MQRLKRKASSPQRFLVSFIFLSLIGSNSDPPIAVGALAVPITVTPTGSSPISSVPEESLSDLLSAIIQVSIVGGCLIGDYSTRKRYHFSYLLQ